MRKTNWVFGFVVAYILAAFGWWTLALLQSNNSIYLQELTLLDEQLHRARHDIKAALKTGLFYETTADSSEFSPELAYVYLQQNYPNLKFRTDENISEDNFLEVKPIVLAAIEKEANRKKWMYLGEGIVFIGLLLWGIILIYRSYGQKIMLNMQKTNFLLSITHELRSPLASAKLMMQTIQKRKLTEVQTNALLESGINEIDRLNELLEKVLLAAKFDNGQIVIAKEKIDFSQLCDKIFYKFEILFENQYQFFHHIEPNLLVVGDEVMLNSAVYNLMENAIKYTPSGGKIGLNLVEIENQIKLTISDSGVGVPVNEKTNIFDKFYRVGSEETRSTKGTGLGLYIVKTIVREHLGKISVESNLPNGSIFVLQMPRATA